MNVKIRVGQHDVEVNDAQLKDIVEICLLLEKHDSPNGGVAAKAQSPKDNGVFSPELAKLQKDDFLFLFMKTPQYAKESFMSIVTGVYNIKNFRNINKTLRVKVWFRYNMAKKEFLAKSQQQVTV